ncbi:hypothetical protein Tco_1191661 [Tanacetum coccineum]
MVVFVEMVWWRGEDDGDEEGGQRRGGKGAGVAVEGDGDVNGGVKGIAMMSGGRVWGRWGDEVAGEPLVAGVWVAGGWPERVAAPDSGGGRRNPNGRRGRDESYKSLILKYQSSDEASMRIYE